MKKYDTFTRKWVTEEELAASKKKFKKRKLCRGGKEHDYILVLPPYVQTKDTVLGIDVAEDYYRIEREKQGLVEAKERELEELGVVSRRGWGFLGGETRHYICSVCQKESYKSSK